MSSFMGGIDKCHCVSCDCDCLLKHITTPEACLASKPVQGASLALEGVHDVHGSHSLAASMLSVGDSITDDVLEEDLEHRAGLLVDKTRDALDTTAASEAANGRLGDALDVITENLAMTLGASLSESFTSLSTS